MKCRRIFCLLLVLFMAVSQSAAAAASTPASAGQAQTETEPPGKKSAASDPLLSSLVSETEPQENAAQDAAGVWHHVALVWQGTEEEETLRSLGAAAAVLTQLGYTADYYRADEEERIRSLLAHPEKYNGVIVLTGENGSLADGLAGYDGSILALGTVTETLARARGISGASVLEGTQAGCCSYPFAGAPDSTYTICLKDPLVMVEESGSSLYREGEYRAERGSSPAYPLVFGNSKLRDIVLQDYSTSLAQAVLAEEITLWMWPYEDSPHRYTEYLVIDGIYPFSDPVKLLDIVQYLKDRKMNYVLSVMPLYDHGDYPSMQKLCSVLRYAQDDGGGVILHSPVLQNSPSEEEIQEKLTDAWESYTENGVYPAAFSVPSEWILGQDLTETLGRFRTLFLEDTDAFFETDPSTLERGTRSFLALGSQLVSPAVPLDESGVGYLDTNATFCRISLTETEEEIRAVIEAAKSCPVPMSGLWDAEQKVYLNQGGSIIWDGDRLLVNGEEKSLAYEEREIPDDFDYRRNVYYRATASIAGENRILIGFSIIVIGIFLLLAVRSRRQMKRRFLFRTGERRNRKEEEKTS